MNINLVITGVDALISFVFAILVLRQYVSRKKMHQLTWGIALILWTIGVLAELFATANNGNWSSLIYRTYYATGALLIPAWLGMGTLYLVMRHPWADWIFKVLIVLSFIGVLLIAMWPIEASALQTTDGHSLPLHVFPFFPVQILLIVLNIFGTIAFVGGALWSAYHFLQMRTQAERVASTVLIAIGGGIAASAHSLGVLSGIELFRVSELCAVIFIFAGFILTTPIAQRKPATAPNTVS